MQGTNLTASWRGADVTTKPPLWIHHEAMYIPYLQMEGNLNILLFVSKKTSTRGKENEHEKMDNDG